MRESRMGLAEVADRAAGNDVADMLVVADAMLVLMVWAGGL